MSRSPASVSSPFVVSRRETRGFSLMELLTVIALLGVLAGIGSLSLKGSGGAYKLSTAGTQCANLLESAREAAILRKNPVAVAIFPGSLTAPAALTAFEYHQDSQNWTRISRWEKLPNGVVPDSTIRSDINSALGKNSPSLTPPLPATEYAGTSYLPGIPGGYAYLVFLPSGSLLQTHTHPGMLRLVEGIAENDRIQHTGTGENFFDLVINPSTGRLKIVRPN